MDYKKETLAEIAQKQSTIGSKHALVGVDGFVDRIFTPVKSRHGRGDAFDPFLSLQDLGERVTAAAGKSTNIEFYPKIEKLGGNGPIMAYALVAAGAKVRYVGALGKDSIEPVFEDLARKTNAISVCDPGISMMAECDDGKVIFGNTSPLDELTYEAIVGKMGEGEFFDAMSRAHLVGLVNWTMIPDMTNILNAIVERVLPNLSTLEERIFFFDLCDPAKRSEGDLLGLLNTLKRFQNYGRAILGLNLSEAEQVWHVLGHMAVPPTEDGLKEMASTIRQDLNLSCIVIHPVESAACATRDDTWWVQGPFTEKPKITTGAGDHFNAGFLTGQLLGLTPPACLTLAVTFSGHYVRTAKSPSLNDATSFIHGWS
ncbi:MAG: PfkB family carbohydrate kinase [Opitutales bacterium]